MAWFNIQSLKGHISSVTRELLKDGIDETEGGGFQTVAELKNRIAELKSSLETTVEEAEQLRAENGQLRNQLTKAVALSGSPNCVSHPKTQLPEHSQEALSSNGWEIDVNLDDDDDELNTESTIYSHGLGGSLYASGHSWVDSRAVLTEESTEVEQLKKKMDAMIHDYQDQLSTCHDVWNQRLLALDNKHKLHEKEWLRERSQLFEEVEHLRAELSSVPNDYCQKPAASSNCVEYVVGNQARGSEVEADDRCLCGNKPSAGVTRELEQNLVDVQSELAARDAKLVALTVEIELLRAQLSNAHRSPGISCLVTCPGSDRSGPVQDGNLISGVPVDGWKSVCPQENQAARLVYHDIPTPAEEHPDCAGTGWDVELEIDNQSDSLGQLVGETTKQDTLEALCYVQTVSEASLREEIAALQDQVSQLAMERAELQKSLESHVLELETLRLETELVRSNCRGMEALLMEKDALAARLQENSADLEQVQFLKEERDSLKKTLRVQAEELHMLDVLRKEKDALVAVIQENEKQLEALQCMVQDSNHVQLALSAEILSLRTAQSASEVLPIHQVLQEKTVTEPASVSGVEPQFELGQQPVESAGFHSFDQLVTSKENPPQCVQDPTMRDMELRSLVNERDALIIDLHGKMSEIASVQSMLQSVEEERNSLHEQLQNCVQELTALEFVKTEKNSLQVALEMATRDLTTLRQHMVERDAAHVNLQQTSEFAEGGPSLEEQPTRLQEDLNQERAELEPSRSTVNEHHHRAGTSSKQTAEFQNVYKELVQLADMPEQWDDFRLVLKRIVRELSVFQTVVGERDELQKLLSQRNNDTVTTGMAMEERRQWLTELDRAAGELAALQLVLQENEALKSALDRSNCELAMLRSVTGPGSVEQAGQSGSEPEDLGLVVEVDGASHRLDGSSLMVSSPVGESPLESMPGLCPSNAGSGESLCDTHAQLGMSQQSGMCLMTTTHGSVDSVGGMETCSKAGGLAGSLSPEQPSPAFLLEQNACLLLEREDLWLRLVDRERYVSVLSEELAKLTSQAPTLAQLPNQAGAQSGPDFLTPYSDLSLQVDCLRSQLWHLSEQLDRAVLEKERLAEELLRRSQEQDALHFKVDELLVAADDDDDDAPSSSNYSSAPQCGAEPSSLFEEDLGHLESSDPQKPTLFIRDTHGSNQKGTLSPVGLNLEPSEGSASLSVLQTDPDHNIPASQVTSLVFEDCGSWKQEDVERSRDVVVWNTSYPGIAEGIGSLELGNDCSHGESSLPSGRRLETTLHAFHQSQARILELEEQNQAIRAEKYNVEEKCRSLEESERILSAALLAMRQDVARLGACAADLIDEILASQDSLASNRSELRSMRELCTMRQGFSKEITVLKDIIKKICENLLEVITRYHWVRRELSSVNQQLLQRCPSKQGSTCSSLVTTPDRSRSPAAVGEEPSPFADASPAGPVKLNWKSGSSEYLSLATRSHGIASQLFTSVDASSQTDSHICGKGCILAVSVNPSTTDSLDYTKGSLSWTKSPNVGTQSDGIVDVHPEISMISGVGPGGDLPWAPLDTQHQPDIERELDIMIAGSAAPHSGGTVTRTDPLFDQPEQTDLGGELSKTPTTSAGVQLLDVILQRLKRISDSILPNETCVWDISNPIETLDRLEEMLLVLNGLMIDKEPTYKQESETYSELPHQTGAFSSCASACGGDQLEVDLLTVCEERDQLLAVVESMRNDMDLLREGYNAIITDKELLESELDRLQFQIDTNETDDSKEIGELKALVNKFRSEREDLTQTQLLHESALVELRQEVEIARSSTSDCNGQLKLLCSALTERTEDLQGTLLRRDSELFSLQQQLTAAVGDVARLEEALSSLQREHTSSVRGASEAEAWECEFIQSRADSNDYHSLQEQLAGAVRKIEGLEEDLQWTQSEFQSAEQERVTVQKMVEDLRDQLSEVQKEHRRVLLEKEESDRLTLELRGRILHLEAELQSSCQKGDAEAQTVAELRESLSQLELKHQASLQSQVKTEHRIVDLEHGMASHHDGQVAYLNTLHQEKQVEAGGKPSRDSATTTTLSTCARCSELLVQNDCIETLPVPSGVSMPKMDVVVDFCQESWGETMDVDLSEGQAGCPTSLSLLVGGVSADGKLSDAVPTNLEPMFVVSASSELTAALLDQKEGLTIEEPDLTPSSEISVNLEPAGGVVEVGDWSDDVLFNEFLGLVSRVHETRVDSNVAVFKAVNPGTVFSAWLSFVSSLRKTPEELPLSAATLSNAKQGMSPEDGLRFVDSNCRRISTQSRPERIAEMLTLLEDKAVHQFLRIMDVVSVFEGRFFDLEDLLESAKVQLSRCQAGKHHQSDQRPPLDPAYIGPMMEKLSTQSRQIAEQQSEVDSLHYQLHSAEKELHFMGTRVGDLTQALIAAGEEAERARGFSSKQVLDLEKLLTEERLRYQHALAESLKKDSLISTLNETKQSLVQDLQRFQSELAARDSALLELKNEIDSAKRALCETSPVLNQFDSLQKACDFARQLISQQEHVFSQLQTGMDTQVAIWRENFSEQERLHTQALSRATAEILELRQKLETVQVSVQLPGGTQDELRDLRKQLSDALQKAAALETSSNQLRQQLALVRIECDTVREEKHLLLQEKQTVTLLLAEHQEKLSKLEEASGKVRLQLTDLQASQQCLQKAKDDAEDIHDRELERLRLHLVEVEKRYTQEIIAAREQERSMRTQQETLQKDLNQTRLMLNETRSNSQHQTDSVQKQVQSITQQRDALRMQLSPLQEQVSQQTSMISSMQLALDQLHREKEDHRARAAAQLDAARSEVQQVQACLAEKEAVLADLQRVVQHTAELEQLVLMRDDEVVSLHGELSRLAYELQVRNTEISQLMQNADSKLDRSVMKNLLVGYFNAPEANRSDVVRVIGSLIGLSRPEIDEIGTGAPKSAGWISGLLPFGGRRTPSITRDAPTERGLDQSFSELFVNFLEEESKSIRVQQPSPQQINSMLHMEPPFYLQGTPHHVSQRPFAGSHSTGPVTVMYGPDPRFRPAHPPDPQLVSSPPTLSGGPAPVNAMFSTPSSPIPLRQPVYVNPGGEPYTQASPFVPGRHPEHPSVGQPRDLSPTGGDPSIPPPAGWPSYLSSPTTTSSSQGLARPSDQPSSLQNALNQP